MQKHQQKKKHQLITVILTLKKSPYRKKQLMFHLLQDSVCPEPKNFTVMGKTYQLSWNPLCDFARSIRPLILLCFIVAASEKHFA